MKATANATVQVPDAAAPAAAAKQPLWMSMPEDTFNAYLKSAKIGGKRAEEMRQRRAAAGTATSGDAAPSTLSPVFQQEDAKAMAAVQAEKVAEFAEFVTKGKKAQAAVNAVIQAAPAGLVTRYIDPEKIDVQEDWNARVDFGDLAELANSIKAQKALDGHGLINDVRVKEKADGRYALIDGERRLLAVLELMAQGEEFTFGIPAKVEPADATDAELIIKMFTANMGKPFLPYEEAQYYARLKASGMTIAQIEEKTGRSDNSIVGALALLEADEDLVDAVVKGGIGATLGKSIAVNVRGNKAKQKELVTKAKAASKSGDKKAMKAVKKEIDDERRAKAAKKMPGKALKARMLDEHDIAAIGGAAGARLKDLLEKLGMPYDTDLMAWISDDRELQVAATFGALVALRNVMGDKSAPEVKF